MGSDGEEHERGHLSGEDGHWSPDGESLDGDGDGQRESQYPPAR